MLKPTTYELYVLPADLVELECFVQTNKLKMTEHVVTAIEYAVANSLESVQVFAFLKSEFIITIHKDRFLQNLENIYAYYLKDEKYELCERIKTLRIKLSTVSYTLNPHEKTKK